MREMTKSLFFSFNILIFIEIVILNGDGCDKVGQWSCWSPCSHSCGFNGTRERSRQLLNNYCTDEDRKKFMLEEIVSCKTVCCPVNCIYSWGAWSSCKGCGSKGEQTSLRVISQNAKCGGTCNVPSSRKRTCDTGK